MRVFLSNILLLVCFCVSSQEMPKGVYQGFIKKVGSVSSNLLYIQFKESENYTRIELKDGDEYSVKRFSCEFEDGALMIKELSVKSSSSARATPRCKLVMQLNYNKETGYLEGTYSSSDCRNEIGKVVLYPTQKDFSTGKTSTNTKAWFSAFLSDYQAGYPAPHIRKQQMENFVFKPIYFDHDKSDIKEEFKEYLKEMVYIVNGHHDLRISVTGHTDAVGSDAYNIKLSERRAKSIKNYFVSIGLAPDKLQIDFKGEKNPVADNFTQEGKQKNRRVDFAFI